MSSQERRVGERRDLIRSDARCTLSPDDTLVEHRIADRRARVPARMEGEAERIIARLERALHMARSIEVTSNCDHATDRAHEIAAEMHASIASLRARLTVLPAGEVNAEPKGSASTSSLPDDGRERTSGDSERAREAVEAGPEPRASDPGEREGEHEAEAGDPATMERLREFAIRRWPATSDGAAAPAGGER